MKRIKDNLNVITVCTFEALIGILLLIEPIGFTAAIFISSGFLLIITGVFEAGKYFHMAPESAAQSQCLTKDC